MKPKFKTKIERQLQDPLMRSAAQYVLIAAMRQALNPRMRLIRLSLQSHIEQRTRRPEIPLYLFRRLARKWPKHSGNLIYPVPHSEMSAAKAHHLYNRSRYVWDEKYGADQLDLARFILAELGAPVAQERSDEL